MRYAVYFVPRPETPLWSFGCAVLAYDSATGQDVPFLDDPALNAAGGPALSAEPRRYGFHATLKAPFSLADGVDEAALFSAAAAFCAQQGPFQINLKVTSLARFVALTSCGHSAQIERLAAGCVRAFESLRASLTEADRQRRLAAPLSDRQIANVDRWGYPFVFDDFRFHMTLTAPVHACHVAGVASALHERYREFSGPVDVDAITIVRQRTRADRFVVLQRFDFAGA